MEFANYFLDAINDVLAWDLPDEALPGAVIAHAGFMARIAPDEMMGLCSD